MMKHLMILCILAATIASCSSQTPELKSPCVGIEGSPCGDRTPINAHWMNPPSQNV